MKRKDPCYIGDHIIIDLVTKDMSLLVDEGHANRYMTKVTDVADMTCILPPRTFSFPYSSEHVKFVKKLQEEGIVNSKALDDAVERINKLEAGGSGNTSFTVWCESHSSSHSFPEAIKPYISIDLFSCKDFDVDKVISFTRDWYNAEYMAITLLSRYLDRPQEITQWTETWE